MGPSDLKGTPEQRKGPEPSQSDWQKHRGKNTISQWEKKLGKESRRLGSVWRRVLRNLVCLGLESCSGERSKGPLWPMLLMGTFWNIYFSQRNWSHFRYPTPRISVNPGSVSFLLLQEIQGLQMGWNEAGASKERRDLGQNGIKKTKQGQI